MNRPVDEKIVTMKLDNSDFKQKAAETTTLFGRLRDSFSRFTGVSLGSTSKDLNNISDEVNKIDMVGLANGITTVSKRFTDLGVVATTALVNITNRAVDAGLAMARSLTIAPIMQGFNEYELKIGTIRTILSNTEWAGTTLEDVKKTLEELNEYADQTIYNFAQMTQNIGRFTAAGVGLDDATVAIKGLGNLAAVSGSTSEQLNNAMYQMSQGMAAGVFNLMDWNSLVNSGMGGKKTQDALLATARAMGINVDMSNGFRESIRQGWLTSKVFLETMKQFGKDESMIEAATKVRTYTQLIDTLQESIGSGWATTFEHIFGDFEEATNLWSRLGDMLTGAADKSADARNKIFEGVADGGGFLNIFDGIQNGLKPVLQTYGAMKDGFKLAFPPASVERLVQLTNTFKEFTAGLALGTERVKQLTTIFNGIFAIFSTVWEITKRLASAFVNLIPVNTTDSILGLLERMALMIISFNESVKAGNGLTRTIDGLGVIFGHIGRVVGEITGTVFGLSSSIMDGLGNAVDWLVDKLAPVGQIIKDAFGGFGGDEILGAGALVGIGYVVMEIVRFLWHFTTATGSFGMMLEGLGESIKNFAMGIQVANLLLVAVALLAISYALKTLEGVDSADIARGLTALATSLGIMIGGMTLINKLQVVGGLRVATTLIGLAIAVSIMAGALKRLSDLNTGELIRGIGGLVAITASLTLAVVAISRFGGRIGASSLQLIALAGSIYILAQAVNTMASIDTGDLFKSVVALGVIFAQLAIFLKVATGAKLGIGSALGIVVISGALHLMVSAIRKLGEIDTGQLVKGLISIATILAQIAIFSKIGVGPGLFATGAAMLLIAGSINALVGPIEKLGSLSWEQLLKGLGAMTVALLAIAGASALMTGGLAGAAGLLLMAIALNAIAIPIQTFANMTWGDMIKGFIGLAGAMGLVAGGALLLSPAVAPMLAFSVGLLAMGVAVALAGAGIGLLGAGLSALAVLTATSVAAIVSTLALMIQGLTSIIDNIVGFTVKLGIALIEGLGKLIPSLVKTVVDIVISILKTISDRLPEFIKLGADIIVKLIEGLREHGPRIIDAAVGLVIDIVAGMGKAFMTYGPAVVSTVMGLMDDILATVIKTGAEVVNGIFGWIPGITEATTAMGENFSEGFAKGIRNMITKVYSTAKELASGVTRVVKDFLDIRSPSRVLEKLGEYTGQGFADGISSTNKKVASSSKKVANSAATSFKEAMDKAEYRFKMEEIDSKQYISELEKIKKSYGGYPDLVRKANLEIKKVEEDAAKHRDDLRKAEFNHSKQWISDRKYYNELSLSEELAAWERVQARYKQGTEERKEAEREVYRVKKEINDRLTAINNDYMAKVEDANYRLMESERRLNDEYDRAVADRTRSLNNFVGLFDKVGDASDVTGKQLIDNLKGQVKTFMEWSKDIEQLARKGIDEGLLDELREMGPKAAGEIRALNTLTESELSQYSSLWRVKNELAREAAVEELEWLRRDTDYQIALLRDETAAELDMYKEEWINSIKEIKTGATSEMSGLKTSLADVGSNSIRGLINGMNSMRGPLQSKAREMANVVSQTIKEALAIKSPSRVTMGLGEYVGEGLAEGIINRAKGVAQSAKELATTAKDSLGRFLDGFASFDDNELHIKLVVDYDNIDPNKIGSLKPVPIKPDTSMTNSLTTSVASGIRQNDSKDLTTKENKPKKEDDDKKTEKQPIVIQSLLNGRVIAEETFGDISELLNNQTNLDYTMRGL